MSAQLKDKKIGVLMGGLSTEREVSMVTGQAVCDAIQRQGLNVEVIDVDTNIASQLREMCIDLAFIALHGTFGEDGTIQGILEYLKIPYTGSGVLGSAMAFNKAVSKQMFQQHGIPTADFDILYRGKPQGTQRRLQLPVVVKPADQGSSFGISIVKAENQWTPALDMAFKYSEEVVVEKFVEGKLVTVGMRESQPMPIIHIIPKSGFYDYEAKYTPGKTEYICPAKLSAEETRRCEDAAQAVYRVLKGRGFPRVDAILDEQGVPQVLEMNTVPGLTPTSLLPQAASAAGLEFDDLVMEMLKTAQLDYEG